MKQITSIAGGAPVVGPYSLATIENGTVETAGQIALTPEGKLIQDTIEHETNQVMNNLKAILEESGCTFSDVTFAQIFYTDPSSFREINKAYAQHFPDSKYPARATVGVAFLPLEARVEILMRASVPVDPPTAQDVAS